MWCRDRRVIGEAGKEGRTRWIGMDSAPKQPCVTDLTHLLMDQKEK